MAYVAPVHRPSSVRHAISLSFLASDSHDLILARSNYLEIWSPNPQLPDQIVLQHSKALYGKVTLLYKLRPIDASTDHLFVGTDRHHYFILSWNTERRELRTEKSYVDISERASRDSQTGDRIHIDPSNRFLTLECYEGIVHVLPISQAGKGKRKATDHKIGELGDAIPVRIPELFVHATCFVHKPPSTSTATNPGFAILYEDSQGNLHVTVRDLEYQQSLRPQEEPATAELEHCQEVSKRPIDAGANFLIPLPPPIHGFLIVSEVGISHVDAMKYELGPRKNLDQATVFVAWCEIDHVRYALADDYGKLYLLYVTTDDDGAYKSHQIDVLGETSRASSLVHLGNGRIFVGSNQGDSQIVQITPKGLEVLQRLTNIAPILDFTVMDMGNRAAESVVNEFSSGQARIVTGSGAFHDGSLRSVRSGVGLEDQGLIDVMGAQVTTMVGLKTTMSSRDDVLLVSFVDRTRLFSFDASGEVEEIDDFGGFDLAQETLYAYQSDDGRSVQITSNAVLVSNGTDKQTWTPPAGLSISAADAHGSTILLSLQGNALIVLDIAKSTFSIRAEHQFHNEEQLSCITLPRVISGICIVGSWRGNRVSVLDLDTLDSIVTEVVSDEQIPTVPRSLKVANMIDGQLPTLLIGLADGNVVSYTIDKQNASLSGRKSMVLGTQQPNFTILPRGDGTDNIFANCEHPSLIYGSEGRIVYSAVTAEMVTSICPFDCDLCPNAVAIASTDTGELRLALVDEQRTTHVEALPVKETVRRIAYSPMLKAFGMGTIMRTLEAGTEKVLSHFKLVDEVVFKELDTHQLDEDELIECVIRCELHEGNSHVISVERFVVGTAYFGEDSKDGARGRLLVFEVTAERQLKVVIEQTVKGACRCLAAADNNIIAALTKTIVVFSYERDNSSSPYLKKQAVYRTATAPIDITMDGSIIAVTDLMKSLSLLEYTRGENGSQDKLTEVGRHFETVWGTSVAKVADNTYLQSDAEGNLIVLQHDSTSYSAEDRRRLRVTAEMKLGEMVNRIRRIDIVPTAGAIVIPRAFMATVEGSIYLFALIAPDKVDLLMRMQSKMASLVKSPGNVPFDKFRGFKTEVRDVTDEGPFRFVDGTLIEQYLDCEHSVQQEISAHLEIGADELQTMVETLKRTH